MTPEKLSRIKGLVIANRWFEVLEFIPELIAEVERLQRELEDRPDPDFVEFLNEQ